MKSFLQGGVNLTPPLKKTLHSKGHFGVKSFLQQCVKKNTLRSVLKKMTQLFATGEKIMNICLRVSQILSILESFIGKFHVVPPNVGEFFWNINMSGLHQ